MKHHAREKVFGNSVGVAFSLFLLVLAEFVLYLVSGISFFSLAKSANPLPLVIFICGSVIGMAWEYIGQFGFNWWYYPAITRRRWLLALLPLFWGIFMIIMQDVYAILRTIGLPGAQAIIASTLILGFLIEGINLYTHSWVYTGWRAHPIILVLGWLFLLSFTFVIGFNHFIINPFGM